MTGVKAILAIGIAAIPGEGEAIDAGLSKLYQPEINMHP